MPRLAWFTPLPSVGAGIASYNLELLPALASTHQIEIFVDGLPARFACPAADTPVFSAHDFVWKHRQHSYDLIVYQLGNAPCHDYMWAYLVRYPGLVVLQDGQLHHARARSLLQQQRADDYRCEFQFNHPEAVVDLAELGVAGCLGALADFWPMRRIVVESARLIVVHNDWLAAQLREEHPTGRVDVVDRGVPAPVVGPDANATVRNRHGIPADAVLFAAFGRVTSEKRIAQAIRGLVSIVDAVPDAHLLLVGEASEDYDPWADACALGVQKKVTMAGFVPDEEMGDYLGAADVCLCMQWPSSRETSASWLRCLAAGRPTIITDLVHTVDIPALDPRTWTLLHAPQPRSVSEKREHAPGRPAPPAKNGGGESGSVDAVCVSIDIVDEDHSLRLAMRRLATDARLRAALGRRARGLWMERFTLERMVIGYRNVIETACAAPLPDAALRARWPEHFLTDGTEHATSLLRHLELSELRIAEIWRRTE